MTDTVALLADDVRRYGQTRGWDKVVRACEDLRPSATRALVLAFADGVDRQPFEAWARAQRGARPMVVRRLADLRQRPSEAIAAAGVVAVFPSALPSPADLETVQGMLAQLPATARATVVVVGDNACNDADLASVRRLAWGLFVAEPKPTWTQQAFAGTGVGLWCADEAVAGLMAERQTLSAFLAAATSESCAAERTHMAVSHAIALAEASAEDAAFQRALGGPRPATSLDWRPEELRQRLSSRLTVVIDDLRRAWRLALRASAAKLRNEAEAASNPKRHRGSPSAADLDAAVAAAMAGLRDELARGGRTAGAAWEAQLVSLLDAAPWPAIAGAGGPTRTSVGRAVALQAVAPDKLFAEPESIRPQEADLARSDAADRGREGMPGWLVVLAAVIVGALAGAMLAGLLGGAAQAAVLAHHHLLHHVAPHLAPHAASPVAPVVRPSAPAINPAVHPHMPAPGLDLGRLGLGGGLGGGVGGALGLMAQRSRRRSAAPSAAPQPAARVSDWMTEAGAVADRALDDIAADLERRLAEQIAAMTRVAVIIPPDRAAEADAAALRSWRERLAALAI